MLLPRSGRAARGGTHQAGGIGWGAPVTRENETTRPSTAEVSAAGPCDGFGDRDPRGAYVEIRIYTSLSEQRVRISRGGAEGLLAELQGVFANAK